MDCVEDHLRSRVARQVRDTMSVYTDGTHLVSHDLKELHAFAAKVGLKREWFQYGAKKGPGRPAHPHYDLTSIKMFQKALAAGAIKVGERYVAKVSREVGNKIRLGLIDARLWS